MATHLMTHFTRGQTIHFAVTFTDAAGQPFTPTSPKLIVSFPGSNGGAHSHQTLDLVVDGAEWVADWDSTIVVASPFRHGTYSAALIEYAVYSGAPAPKIANQGQFQLDANRANYAGI